MHAFDYCVASSVADAAARLRDNPDARVLAGGMTLIPAMRQRLLSPPALIDLSRVEGLSGIRCDGDRLSLGAMVTHAAVAGSQTVIDALPALAELAAGIGHPQIRHRATIGGSIANNDPAADYTAALLALGATVRTQHREIAADVFFTATYATALLPDEIIVGVDFPVTRVAAYRKFPNLASHYAMAGVFVARFGRRVRVAVTGATPLVYRERQMERALENRFDPDAVASLAIDISSFIEDQHGSADYRGQLVRVMASRAVAAANAR